MKKVSIQWLTTATCGSDVSFSHGVDLKGNGGLNGTAGLLPSVSAFPGSYVAYECARTPYFVFPLSFHTSLWTMLPASLILRLSLCP